MNLQLRKFKPETMTDDRVCVFIGKRNTGKSTLVKDIMFHKKHLPAGIVLSGTCLLYTSPSPRDQRGSRMPSSA